MVVGVGVVVDTALPEDGRAHLGFGWEPSLTDVVAERLAHRGDVLLREPRRRLPLEAPHSLPYLVAQFVDGR